MDAAPCDPADEYEIFESGSHLDKVQVDSLEDELGQDPDNLQARLQLMGFYAESTSTLKAFARHLVWMVDHHPADGVLALTSHIGLGASGYLEELKTCWLRQVSLAPTNLLVLNNAAIFFLLCEPEESLQLWTMAQKEEPENPRWSRELSRVFFLRAISLNGREQETAARKAIQHANTALDLQDKRPTDSYLQRYKLDIIRELAELALRCDLLDSAYALGDKLLNMQPDVQSLKLPTGEEQVFYFSAFGQHAGHSTLGRVALRRGQPDRAKQHLLEMSRLPIPESPDVKLAGALIDVGETAAVIAYIDRCIDSINRRILNLSKEPPETGPALSNHFKRERESGRADNDILEEFVAPLRRTRTWLEKWLMERLHRFKQKGDSEHRELRF